MDVVERAELYLRLRGEELLDPARSVWDSANGGGVERLVAVAEALAAVGAIDSGVFASVLADLELAGWLRQRSLGTPGSVQAAIGNAFAPAPTDWRPSVTICDATLDLSPALVSVCWLTRSGPETRARLRVVFPPPVPEPVPAVAMPAWAMPGLAGQAGTPLASAGAPFAGWPFASAATRPGQLGRLDRDSVDLSRLVVTDDAGVTYRLEWEQFRVERAPLDPVIPEPTIAGGVARFAPSIPATALYLDWSIAGSELPPVRSELSAPAEAQSGRLPDSGVAPARRYLERSESVRRVRRHRAGVGTPINQAAEAETRAAVLRALASLGFLSDEDAQALARPAIEPPAGPPATLLAVATTGGATDASTEAPDPWSHPLGVDLPLERTRVMVEGCTAVAGVLSVHFDIAGDARGMGSAYEGPPFIGAADDLGHTYEQVEAVRAGDEQGQRVSVTLTPALAPGARRLRIVAETPFEAAYVELDLPRLEVAEP